MLHNVMQLLFIRYHIIIILLINFFRQILQHQWAEPFMDPVDVEGLQLHDYYEVMLLFYI